MSLKKDQIDAASLHMGILQNRLHALKGKMQVCMSKISMKEGEEGKNLPDIDIESEKLKFESYNQQSHEIEQNLIQYENKVLELTKL